MGYSKAFKDEVIQHTQEITQVQKDILKKMTKIGDYMDVDNKQGFGKRTDLLLKSTQQMSKHLVVMLIFTAVCLALYVSYLAYMSTSNIELIP